MKEKLHKLLLFIERVKYRRDRHFYVVLFAFMAVLLAVFTGLYVNMKADIAVRDNILESYYDGSSAEQEEEKIKVYICGQVARPGVYDIDLGSRVSDVLELAGGPGPDAALNSMNLARKVADEEKVYVPSEKDTEEAAGSGLVNINSAGQQVLETLPGIGPATAKKIIEYRQSRGPFINIEDIQKVGGIGEKKFEALKDLISV
ncbi:MAG: helix-hairpin-helix domain-containing protein [Actinomycetota bacterium]